MKNPTAATNVIFIDYRVINYQAMIDSLTEPAEVFILVAGLLTG